MKFISVIRDLENFSGFPELLWQFYYFFYFLEKLTFFRVLQGEEKRGTKKGEREEEEQVRGVGNLKSGERWGLVG